MFYILHHPKGTLMISAQNKDQVRKWSQRQLGTQARLVSIFEKDNLEIDGLIEKGGTGIKAVDQETCQPVMCIMANFVQNMSDISQADHIESDNHVNSSRLKCVKPMIH